MQAPPDAATASARVASAAAALDASPPLPPYDPYDSYLDRLLKLIPAEVIGLYLVLAGFVPEDGKSSWGYWLVFAIGILAIVVVRWKETKPSPGGPPQKWSIFIALVAYVVWVYSIGGPFEVFLGTHYVRWVGSIAVVCFTFFVPYVYKGDPAPPPA